MVGDILEWLAACLLVAAAYFGVGTALALAAGGLCLAYFAQCYGATPLPRREPDRTAEPPA